VTLPIWKRRTLPGCRGAQPEWRLPPVAGRP
jgi:hypothetical protein